MPTKRRGGSDELRVVGFVLAAVDNFREFGKRIPGRIHVAYHVNEFFELFRRGVRPAAVLVDFQNCVSDLGWGGASDTD